MSEVIIRAEGLVKTFRDFWRRPIVRAVDNLSFELKRGEQMAIIGPNGSGKSTTLKLLLGFLRPEVGTIEILGYSPTSIEAKHRIGFLPEISALHTFLTPRQTLDFYASLFGIDKPTRRRRIDELLEMVRLTPVADRCIAGFSKGMMRRVGLAQALINAPDLLLLDEPTSGLDPEACHEMKELLLALKSIGVSVLMTSHVLGDVEEVCDRVLVMRRGQCVLQGEVNSLLRQERATQLTLEDLTPGQIATLREELSARYGCPIQIDTPAISLEKLFLQTIATDATPFRPAPFLMEAR